MRLRWFALAAGLAFALVATWSLVRAQPPHAFSGDSAAGATMHDRDCIDCHVRRVGGDGSGMYTRAERRVRTPAQLKAQIAVCNTELGASYFPEEEEHLATYLNQRYYRFAN